jgi:DNA ligase D-like protein (predicted ligase)
MLAKLGEPFSSDKHLFEIKWDGTRAIALAEAGALRVYNRHRNRLDGRYPELGALEALPDGTALDGEVTVMRDGMPDFPALLSREQARGKHRVNQLTATLPATYFVFDLLYERGASVMDRTLVERRDRLRPIIAQLADRRIVMTEGIVGDGVGYFRKAVEADLEGVVAKRLDSRYLPGQRTDAWTKFKKTHVALCVIIGYVPDGEKDLRSLAIATETDGALVSVGRVGSGLDVATRRALTRRLAAIRRSAPVVRCRLETGTRWVEPEVYCQVKYLERTVAGELRAPVFVGVIE